MKQQVLADTGPLVALINKRDRHHAWASDQATRLPAPFLTCEAVLSEACFLLRNLDILNSVNYLKSLKIQDYLLSIE